MDETDILQLGLSNQEAEESLDRSPVTYSAHNTYVEEINLLPL